MKLIIGLGNPGLTYRHTRHNVGFQVVKELARRHKIRVNKNRCRAKIGQGTIAGSRALLAMPQTFMNLSGEAVKAIVESRQIAPADILVACDDVNLNLGILRIRAKGTAGGHKGLASIVERLKADNFARLRVGIGREGIQGDLTGFVLRPFRRDEQTLFKAVLDDAALCCESWIKSGTEKTANKYNKRNT